MGFFSKLFGKNDGVEVFDYANNRLRIDCSEFGININGKYITLPARFSDFAFLGKARKVKTQAGINYVWDQAGVYCYTRDNGKVVHCFGIAMQRGEFTTTTSPLNLYNGTLTINGSDWRTEADKGEATEVFKKLKLGKHSVVAEYCRFMDSSEYGNIEIQPE